MADLIVSPDNGGGPRVTVYNGVGFGTLADFFGIDDPHFRGGVRAAVGDVNGDGHADLIVAAGVGGGPRVAIYDGSQLVPTGGPRLVGDYFAFEDTLRNGVYVAAGDLNGDGKAEVIVGAGPGGGPRVSAFKLNDLAIGDTNARVVDFFAGDPSNRGGVPVAVKDLDNDNLADVVIGGGQGSPGVMSAYLGLDLITGNATAPKYQLDITEEPNGLNVG